MGTDEGTSCCAPCKKASRFLSCLVQRPCQASPAAYSLACFLCPPLAERTPSFLAPWKTVFRGSSPWGMPATHGVRWRYHAMGGTMMSSGILSAQALALLAPGFPAVDSPRAASGVFRRIARPSQLVSGRSTRMQRWVRFRSCRLTPPDKPSLPDSGNGGSPCPQ